MDGGGNFRANFGVERDGSPSCRGRLALQGSDITTGYPQFDSVLLKKLGCEQLTASERARRKARPGRLISRATSSAW